MVQLQIEKRDTLNRDKLRNPGTKTDFLSNILKSQEHSFFFYRVAIIEFVKMFLVSRVSVGFLVSLHKR